MASIENSRRRLEKVTYTPLILPESDEQGGALQTAAAVAALGLVSEESALAARGATDRERRALMAMEEYASAQDAGSRLAASAKLGLMPNSTLAAAVDAIRGQRDRVLTETFQDLTSLIREYQAARRSTPPPPGAGASFVTDRLSIVEHQLAQLLPASAMRARTRLDAFSVDTVTAIGAQTEAPAPPPAIRPPEAVAARLGRESAADAYAAASWADTTQPERARRFTEIPAAVIPRGTCTTAVDLLMKGLTFIMEQARKTTTVKTALTRRQLQPLGLLHLEQLVVTPLDVERGELVYTLPLAPRERVTLSHKEWSIRQEEYSRFVQDYFENYSERGVAEKTDIAVSSKSETEHTKTLSMSRPLGPGSATLADPVDTQAAGSDVTKEKQSQEQSRRDTKEITEKASALAIRDQKQSFTVSTVSGSQDFTSRLYENTHEDKVMIVDYFRRMRKWRNQLFRTGIRLTYDVVLPDPGRRLRERWSALSAIDAQLGTAFEFSLGSGYVPAGSATLLTPSLSGLGATDPSLGAAYNVPNDIESMSATDIERMARDYSVTLPPTPDSLKSVEKIKAITEVPLPNTGSISFELTLPIPEDYRPTTIWIGGRLAPGSEDQYFVGDYWTGRPS